MDLCWLFLVGTRGVCFIVLLCIFFGQRNFRPRQQDLRGTEAVGAICRKPPALGYVQPLVTDCGPSKLQSRRAWGQHPRPVIMASANMSEPVHVKRRRNPYTPSEKLYINRQSHNNIENRLQPILLRSVRGGTRPAHGRFGVAAQ